MKNALYFQASQGMRLTFLTMRVGTIAQLVEQRTFNPFVVGSTPAGPTKNLKKDLDLSKSFFLAISLLIWLYDLSYVN